MNFYTVEANNIKNNYINSNNKTLDITNISDFNYKNINASNGVLNLNKTQVVYCGVENWDNKIQYPANTKVLYNCKIWQSPTWKISANQTPGENNLWQFVDFCDESPNCDIETLSCGVTDYNPNIIYNTRNIQVIYNCKIWRNIGYANPGVSPGGNNYWAWEFVSFCDEGSCNTNTYCDVYEYDSDIKYKINTKVYYNCAIWVNIHGNVNPGVLPNGVNSWAWKFVDYCEENNNCTFYGGALEYDRNETYQPGMKVYYDGKVWINNKSYNITTTPNINNNNPWTLEKTLSVEDDLLKENIVLYYNNNKIYYDFTKLENTSQIICYDTKGSIIFSKNITNSKDIIDLPSIKQGLYFLQVLNNNAKTFKKIIVL
jgi:hypothetical protein